jgi:hypothetical protein
MLLWECRRQPITRGYHNQLGVCTIYASSILVSLPTHSRGILSEIIYISVSAAGMERTSKRTNEREKGKKHSRKLFVEIVIFFVFVCWMREKIETCRASGALCWLVAHFGLLKADRAVTLHSHSASTHAFESLSDLFIDFSTRSNMALCALTPLDAFRLFSVLKARSSLTN